MHTTNDVSQGVLFLLFLWFGFVCCCLCKDVGLLNLLALEVGVWTNILQCLVKMGAYLISFKSALKGFSPIYGGTTNGVRKAKELSIIVFLFELQRTIMLVWKSLSALFGVWGGMLHPMNP